MFTLSYICQINLTSYTLECTKSRLNLFGPSILAIVLLFFRIPISKLLDFLFVRRLFADFETNWCIDVIYVLLLAFIVYRYSRQLNKKLVKTVMVYAIVFYGFQRFNPYWVFDNMVLISPAAYWDLLMFALTLSFLLSIMPVKIADLTLLSDRDTGFVEDAEITTEDEDHFKRKFSAAQVAALIANTNNTRSFAIGILGEYGSGKSSFLNLINLKFDEKRIIKFSFNPWSSSSTGMIRKEFFDLLSSKIAVVDPNISSLMNSYGRSLSNIDEVRKSGSGGSIFSEMGKAKVLLRPVLSKVFPLSQIGQAHRLLEFKENDENFYGKIGIQIGNE